MPSDGYIDMLSMISSKGLGAVVVAWDAYPIRYMLYDHPSPLDVNTTTTRALNVLEFITSGLLQQTIHQRSNIQINTTQMLLSCHSSGCQIVVLLSKIVYSVGLISLILLILIL